jgi:hypothetical protein
VRKRTRRAAKDDGPDRLQTQKLEKTQNSYARETRATADKREAQSAIRADTQPSKKQLAPPISRGLIGGDYNMLNPAYKTELSS